MKCEGASPFFSAEVLLKITPLFLKKSPIVQQEPSATLGEKVTIGSQDLAEHLDPLPHI